MRLSDLYWYRITPLHSILWPLSVLYRFYLTLKKLCYWLDILPSARLPVPVMMIDSISIDDGGKTPLVVWLINCLVKQGYRPGIIARSSYNNYAISTVVTSVNDPSLVGERIFQLSQRYKGICPVWVGDDRTAVAQALLDNHPACNIIICTDSLHYYRLEQDIEILVIDFTEQSYGNGLILPAGPLRVSLGSLKKFDIVVTHGEHDYVDTSQWGKTYRMKLANEVAYQLLHPEIRQPIVNFKDRRLYALASEDNGRWFFDFIQKIGLNAELHHFSENHHFTEQDIDFPETDIIVIMPEGDALQCHAFAKDTLWVLPQEAWVGSELETIILRKLGDKYLIDNLY